MARLQKVLLLAAVTGLVSATPSLAGPPVFTDTFMIEKCQFSTTGSNPFFILQPGYQLVLEGQEQKVDVELTITVLDETLIVDGVETRVVEELEKHDGEIVEISRNYFAICAPTNTVFYFGEDVDIYEGGVLTSHEGSWHAGTDGARPGVIMPGLNLVGARYFQEVAPDVAMDRAETISVSEAISTPVGEFQDVLKVEETTPLESGAKSFKFYAPDVGLIQDDTLQLVGASGLRR
jgi:hypothetical protein